ncbi:MAG: cytochrome ubiquinol oxidase subunit I, partial [Marmoricola sp.]
DGFTTLNQVSTIGAFLLALSMVPFFMNLYKTSRAPKVTVDDPWGWGRTLEWATACPAPRHNFVSIPRIRSDSPAFELHHPEIAALEYADEDGLGADEVPVGGPPPGDSDDPTYQERGDDQ